MKHNGLNGGEHKDEYTVQGDEIDEQQLIDKQCMELAINSLDDNKLDHAIVAGMKQGQSMNRSIHRSKALLPIAAAICAFVLFATAVHVSPAFAAALREIPGLKSFVQLLASDNSLKQAIDEDFVQSVNVSDHKGGYTLTVHGVIADNQRFVLLYSVAGVTSDKLPSVEDFQLLDGDNEEIQGMIASDVYGDTTGSTELTQYKTIDVMMETGKPVPDQIRFRVKVMGQWLEADFPIDHERFDHLEETVMLHRFFEIAGQRFEIEKAVITPLRTTLVFHNDPANSKQPNSFIDARIVDEKGRMMPFTNGFGTAGDEQFSMQFQSSFFTKAKHLTFETDGLLLSDKNQKLTVNTDTLETLAAPDKRMRLELAVPTNEGIELTFLISDLMGPELHYGFTMFQDQVPFYDGAGRRYSMIQPKGVHSVWRQSAGSGETRVYYTIPKEDYKQPLTFDVYQYPGYVLQNVELPIK
ncbi:DUF4179 domain-containing protein [Paenibacillus protaetiae]|uniref:DUF4179 domain-containing protein n=1 Tax=Paenibacillus protaetiae TaxID=2509456 RepID=A0A4P6EVL9_9BACL|nr:DUF4179 domain-containing protein [Paenibacillus protaetiae]QAY67340.1 DUF4179 domain-containing protein [Paenibacillus protaetiae]